MATPNEVKMKRAEVLGIIKEKLRDDPDVGPHEFVGHFLQAKGIEVDTQNPEAIRNKVKELSGKDKSDTVRALSEYRKHYDKAITDLDKGLHHNITELPRKAIAAITKGAGIGVGIAGAVNTVAPGLFSTAVTWLAAKEIISQSWLVNAGLITTSIFAPPAVSAGAVIGVGAAVGAITYVAGKAVVSGVKALYNGIKDRKEEKER